MENTQLLRVSNHRNFDYLKLGFFFNGILLEVLITSGFFVNLFLKNTKFSGVF